MLLNLIYTVVGATLVLIGANKLTDGSVGLAKRFGIPELVIGLTVVAFGTSLPEFIVSLLAGIRNDVASSALSISNVVGSNLFNTLVIAGVSAVFCPIAISRSTVNKDIPLCILASTVLMALALDDIVSGGSERFLTRGDGVALLAFFIIFMSYSLGLAKHRSRREAENGEVEAVAPDDTAEMPMSGLRIALYIVLGLAGLLGGGQLFVNGACGVAREAGVSEAVIGLTLVAGGTSLPELATSIVAARKGQSALAIGNVVGSNLFNIFWILGACSCIMPLPVTGLTPLDFLMLLGSSVCFWLFSRTSYRLARWEGALMASAYVVYIIWLIY
ncbi:MAG: calcium/sodium antiporter [Bacteroidaceae bacterium]|nr:calcium/sodium antiporter [Bacteroidaceae bacterium]